MTKMTIYDKIDMDNAKTKSYWKGFMVAVGLAIATFATGWLYVHS